MDKVDVFLEEAVKNKSNWVYVENLLFKDKYTYEELVTLLVTFSKKVKENVLVKCQIFSENEIAFSNLDTLLSSFVDTEWDEPRIEFAENLVWYPQNDEKIIKITNLSESLIAVYCAKPDYCLTIMSRELYESRVVSEEIQLLLSTISYGDIKLKDVEKRIENTGFRESVDYLIQSKYIFAVHKNLVDEVEFITNRSFIDWEQVEKYSVEFTKKGREHYAKNELGIDVMKFIHNNF
ncbi:hypothetical protein ACWOFR_00170 [Carnobacterium gallinarum]|uniref:hypothetical protein n=1 Tax=Carnobacterium gallinarum TaxID=2749 RepID=UPI00054EC639|nr:hypothetical protein [Carnobacterium gallinarum]